MKYGILEIEYPNGEIIPTIVMGDGSVRVSNLLMGDDNMTGVAFSPAPKGTKAGDYVEEDIGKTTAGMGVYFQLLFDNPVSIDVVINRLLAAKKSLEEGDGSD